MRRYGWNPRTRRYEYFEDISQDNAGTVSVDTSGDLSVGIGGGLGIDTKNGDLTIQVVPGFSVDLGSGTDLFGSGS